MKTKKQALKDAKKLFQQRRNKARKNKQVIKYQSYAA